MKMRPLVNAAKSLYLNKARPMKSSILLVMAACLLACSGSKTTDATTVEDTISVNVDTVSHQNITMTDTTSTMLDDSIQNDDDEVIQEKGENVYLSQHQFSFISNPYDFSLDASTIENLLGEQAQTKTESFEGGEDYGPYTYTTITLGDNEISFYDYAGKHFSNITTPLLPLKNGIKIGMKKADFQTAMGFNGELTSTVNIFRLVDDYGNMDFSFRGDTLYLIYARYEEGD
jgi:hypothetical protein